MSSLKAKLASTASGMSFEEWKNRPVYKAQCFTASIAHMLCGIHTRPGRGHPSVAGHDVWRRRRRSDSCRAWRGTRSRR